MTIITMPFKRTTNTATPPQRMTPEAAGLDLALETIAGMKEEWGMICQLTPHIEWFSCKGMRQNPNTQSRQSTGANRKGCCDV